MTVAIAEFPAAPAISQVLELAGRQTKSYEDIVAALGANGIVDAGP